MSHWKVNCMGSVEIQKFWRLLKAKAMIKATTALNFKVATACIQ